MTLQIFDSYSGISCAIAQEISQQLRQKPDSLFCLAAGETSLGIFDALIDRFHHKQIDFSSAFFIAMDEWMGMSPATSGSCGDFLNRHFLNKVNFMPGRVRLIDGTVTDSNTECASVRAFIEARGGIDFLLLGIGMNGHLALNEPGVDFGLSVHTTELDSVTKMVGKKYFQTPNPKLTGGITIGMHEIRSAKRVILSVSGIRKQEILRRVVNQPVSNSVPATILNELPQADIYCDRDAAGDFADCEANSSF